MPPPGKADTSSGSRCASDRRAALACASHLDGCDFHWQEFYFYKTPPTITTDSELQLTCGYDTSADTAPVLPGWGTRNETSLTVLMVALPPG